MKFFQNHIILLFIILLLSAVGNAQTSFQKNEILEELNSDVQGKGDVKVYQDESITHILGRPMGPPRTVYTTGDGSVQYYKTRGYKIQAFSGNNQRTSRDEANRKQSMINQLYPDQETVVLFESPFWRLRVGNFETREEAEHVMQDLRASFPSFGREMYIVVDEVKIAVN
ncbi:MAG: SPOR domain-containing protein [Fermentimonas sp.]|nr:SPOR domain-containing protein [Fermentimonas sp.]